MITTQAGFIAIVGRPNSGKSTLLNYVLKTRLSIVTPKAQTTRERVLGILTEKNSQIVFIDTPGIHRAREGGINEYMVSEAREALDAPSATWYIVDPSSALEHEKAVLDLLDHSKAPVFVLINKSDIRKIPLDRRQLLETTLKEEMLARGIQVAGIHHISGMEGKGVEPLLQAAWALLPPSPFYYPDAEQLSDRPTRFFVAEKIREQLYLCLGQELPYSCAVEIEKFDEVSVPKRIEAMIHVERDSQKGMVIGKAGAKIKEIGTEARREVEEFLGEKIFLGLKVGVLKDWTKDSEAMKRMGYHLPGKKGRAS